MAVFMLNICKFNDCGLTFQNLGDLIQHIEDNHIDYDPQVIEEKEQEQPSCLPLSYVLRFFTDAARKEVLSLKPKLKSIVEKPATQLPVQTPISNGNEADDVFSESEDSNDSWSTQEEFSSEFILKYGSKMVSPTTLPDGTVIEKPFACPVPGCKKRYKNVNGIKYHSKNGHKNEGKIRKGFKCYCGKSYKTNGGLKNHTALMHSGTTMTTIATQNGTPQVLQIPTLQPIRTLTLKHIASLGLPVKTLVVATKSQDKTAKTTSSLGVLTPATSPDSPEKPPEIVLSDN
ncbi:juxtaposed with another zinc finger protein 1 [Halyomorpha halys]|uniref:juxtaposed with another zinc finger protein 1 n=1 Tax=Halyomorpha halys TaxID=286706 RepID=UPI0006D4EFF7|nr:juxtaposed with another zinc finger protein 1 [Halyomorpha halys]